jgi:flagellar hook-associated protein 2
MLIPPRGKQIAQDTASQTTAINNFVNLYNTLVTTMGALTQFSSGSSSQGPLLGDSTLNVIQNSLATIVANGVKSGTKSTSLGSIGITLRCRQTARCRSTVPSSTARRCRTISRPSPR